MGKNGKHYRKVDRFGRIVLPNGIRKNINADKGNIVTVSQENGAMIIRPTEITCILCGSNQGIDFINDIPFCEECRERQNQNRASEEK